jgi:hypothetical protein
MIHFIILQCNIVANKEKNNENQHSLCEAEKKRN